MVNFSLLSQKVEIMDPRMFLSVPHSVGHHNNILTRHAPLLPGIPVITVSTVQSVSSYHMNQTYSLLCDLSVTLR